MEMKKHEILEHKLCKELDNISEKLSGGAEMTAQDLQRVDMIYHALKSLATYKAMKEAEDYEEDGWSNDGSMGGGNSGRRGRAANGRYVSRDSDQNYAEGYSQGYMDGQQSGHMPMYPPRRW